MNTDALIALAIIGAVEWLIIWRLMKNRYERRFNALVHEPTFVEFSDDPLSMRAQAKSIQSFLWQHMYANGFRPTAQELEWLKEEPAMWHPKEVSFRLLNLASLMTRMGVEVFIVEHDDVMEVQELLNRRGKARRMAQYQKFKTLAILIISTVSIIALCAFCLP